MPKKSFFFVIFYLTVVFLELSNPIQELELLVLTKKTMEGHHRNVRYDPITTLSPSSILGDALETSWTSLCHWLNSILEISTAASAIALAAVKMQRQSF